MHAWQRRAPWVLVLLLALVAGVRAQDAAPSSAPLRVGRIAETSGDVRLFDARTRDWTPATRNRSFGPGERLAVASGGSAQVEVGASALLLDGDTEIEAARLDDERLQFTLHRGSVALRLHPGELELQPELTTPQARFQPLRAGLYRIDLRADGSSGGNWHGLLRATTPEQVLTVEPGQRVGLPADTTQRAQWSALQDDAFARRVLRETDRPAAVPETVPADMTGVAELGRHGSWLQHPQFGWVWTPTTLPLQWEPYRFGQWTWVQPWGWTWVDAAPWGFAPFHYGRWLRWDGRWVWMPGPPQPRLHTRPAPGFMPGVVPR